MNFLGSNNLGRLGLGSAGAEAVLEATVNSLEVPHAASAGSATAGGLEGPVVRPNLGGGVAASSTTLLLEVPCVVVATLADRAVALGVALAHRRSTFTHD